MKREYSGIMEAKYVFIFHYEFLHKMNSYLWIKMYI